jgi:hypothetical protein
MSGVMLRRGAKFSNGRLSIEVDIEAASLAGDALYRVSRAKVCMGFSRV